MIRGMITIVGVFCIIGTGTIACSDSDIVHPVLCYHRLRVFGNTPPDSVLVGKMTFDPLPEYQKPSKVLIEWYCDREITKDLNVRVEGPVWNYQIARPLPVWHAPIHKGDTVRAELTITPLTVGIVDLRVYAGEPGLFPQGDSMVPCEISRASLRTAFVLGPNGQTTAMNSPATNQPYATFLGPLPEVMAESLLFLLDPKFPEDLLGLNPVSPPPGKPVFAVEGIVYTQPDDSGYRKITCRVSPYRQFDAGIGFAVRYSENMYISDVSPSWTQAVWPKDTISFSFRFRASASGISHLFLYFQTANPDFGKPDSPNGNYEREEVGCRLPIHIAYDKDMTPLVITDQAISNRFGGYSLSGEWTESEATRIQEKTDFRIGWLKSLESIDIHSNWKAIEAEGYDKVLNFGRKPVEVVPKNH
jgi:hypothetical protein